MRISDNQRYRISNHRVNIAKSDNQHKMEQISTQKRINRVSDDPVALGRVIKYKSGVKDMEQFQRNIEFTKGYIERSEASLSGINDALVRAKELSVSLASDTFAHDSRLAASREVDQLIQGIVALANSQYGNRYVFGGFRSLTPPLSRDGVFTGDDGAIFLQTDYGGFQQINLQARELFSATNQEQAEGHQGMIDTLLMLKDGLKSDDVPTIRKAMDGLDYQMSKTTDFIAKLGAIHNGVEGTLKRLEISQCT